MNSTTVTVIDKNQKVRNSLKSKRSKDLYNLYYRFAIQRAIIEIYGPKPDFLDIENWSGIDNQ